MVESARYCEINATLSSEILTGFSKSLEISDSTTPTSFGCIVPAYPNKAYNGQKSWQ